MSTKRVSSTLMMLFVLGSSMNALHRIMMYSMKILF